LGYVLKVKVLAGPLDRGVRNRGIKDDTATGRIDGVAMQ